MLDLAVLKGFGGVLPPALPVKRSLLAVGVLSPSLSPEDSSSSSIEGSGAKRTRAFTSGVLPLLEGVLLAGRRRGDGDGLSGSRSRSSGGTHPLEASLFGGCDDGSRTPRRLGVFRGSSSS